MGKITEKLKDSSYPESIKTNKKGEVVLPACVIESLRCKLGDSIKIGYRHDLLADRKYLIVEAENPVRT